MFPFETGYSLFAVARPLLSRVSVTFSTHIFMLSLGNWRNCVVTFLWAGIFCI
jgi:hypothetical protein